MKQRQAVTAVTVQRYRQGSKKIKQQILDEFCETTGYCRGYARFVLRNHGRQVGLRGRRVIVGDVHQRQQRLKPRGLRRSGSDGVNQTVGVVELSLWQTPGGHHAGADR